MNVDLQINGKSWWRIFMKSVAALCVINVLFWVIQVLFTILEDTLRALDTNLFKLFSGRYVHVLETFYQINLCKNYIKIQTRFIP